MKNSTIIKSLTTFIVAIFIGYVVYGFVHALNGNFSQNASFITTALMSIVVCLVVGVGVWLLVKLWRSTFAIIIGAGILLSCSYAKSNQQVVVSTDCGMVWKKVTAGDAVPKGTTNPCFMKVVMPNYPMQGEISFITNLAERVRAHVSMDYDYSIIEPLAFINQAKYLGKANTDADSGEALDPKQFEGAENIVIDKRIKDVAKGLFLKEDIVELDQAQMEDELLAASNKILEPLGIKLNFITLTFDLDEQTRQAIDIATAMKIYESKGLGDLGNKVMAARAGATKITVNSPAAQPTE